MPRIVKLCCVEPKALKVMSSKFGSKSNKNSSCYFLSTDNCLGIVVSSNLRFCLHFFPKFNSIYNFSRRLTSWWIYPSLLPYNSALNTNRKSRDYMQVKWQYSLILFRSCDGPHSFVIPSNILNNLFLDFNRFYSNHFCHFRFRLHQFIDIYIFFSPPFRINKSQFMFYLWHQTII